jgi:hypothetical protein
MKLSPKTCYWGAGILGILLVVCGFLSQQTNKPNKKTNECAASPYTWVPIIVGFLMLLVGFICLLKGGKTSPSSSGMGGMGGGDASISPESTPGGMM